MIKVSVIALNKDLLRKAAQQARLDIREQQ